MQGIAKSGLMGFCDCVPGHPKQLKVLFMHKNQPYVVTLAEKVRSLQNVTPCLVITCLLIIC